MNMVWHDAPFEHAIAVGMSGKQGSLENVPALGLSENAAAVPAILIAGNHPVQFAISRLVIRKIAQFPFPLMNQFRWDRVRQSESNGLNRTREVPVFQVATIIDSPVHDL